MTGRGTGGIPILTLKSTVAITPHNIDPEIHFHSLQPIVVGTGARDSVS
jgi:hypothetical protein